MVLLLSLSIVALLAWDINSQVVLPELIQKAKDWSLNGENIGSYLSVLTGIVAFLFPASLHIISDSKGDNFNSQEVTEIVFNHWTYNGLKWILGSLVALTIASFFDLSDSFLLILILIVMAISLVFLFFFFKRLEIIMEDFSLLVRKVEKKKIEEIL
jgi:hypothetical protein